jgi:leucyl-tRNA synthetase
MNYSFVQVEEKWQSRWNQLIRVWQEKATKGEYYCLDMFPYPSGSGLHVGHWRGYVLSDIYARKKMLEGYNVLHPMGWDAFGLPAENYAITHKIHPEKAVKENIAVFKEQLYKIGALYDWSKEINTTDPEYYRWTQWIFLKMYKAGLAYESFVDINWCPSCKTGLANEEATNKTCDRCGTHVEQKKIRQWVLKITQYAEELLEGLDRLEWPEKVKSMQRNWIGKSNGLEINFKLLNHDLSITVFTSRPETLYGVTFIAISSTHQLLNTILPHEHKESVLKEIPLLHKYEKQDNSHKGLFTHAYVIHPLTQEKIPVYIADYVIEGYGTGALMGVPAHDERDYAFALKNSIRITYVIQNQNGDNNGVYEGDGILMNSGNFDGLLACSKGREALIKYIVEKNIGQKKINYKMRDWIFSRQRYWGEPIPLVHCKVCGIVPVPEHELPIRLPMVESYEPTGTGESPLAHIAGWVNVTCPSCKQDAKRETNTMPQWAGSCWYFLRYPSPQYQEGLCDPKELSKYLPVNLYIGGIEHAILHLLYARFYVKFLYEEKIIPFNEPFLNLFNQGMVNRYSEKTGLVEKMSKSKGNVVNPNDLVEKYGSDALRMYIVFMGPPEADCEWQDNGIEGCTRFLKKLWTIMTSPDYSCEDDTPIARKIVHTFLKQFINRIDTMHTNTAVSAAMEFVNSVIEHKIQLSKHLKVESLVLLSTIIPHITAEILDAVCNISLTDIKWPSYNPLYIQDDIRTIVIQANGKTRETIQVDMCLAKKDLEIIASDTIAKWLKGKEIIKIIHVGDKLINFVYKEKSE